MQTLILHTVTEPRSGRAFPVLKGGVCREEPNPKGCKEFPDCNSRKQIIELWGHSLKTVPHREIHDAFWPWPLLQLFKKNPLLISLLLTPGFLRATCLKIRQRSPRGCLRPHLTFMVCPQKAPLVPYSVGGMLPTRGNLNFIDIHLGTETHISIHSYILEIS